MFGNGLGNAAVGAINEAQWKAAEPSVNKQAGAIVDSIIGDGSGSATGNVDPIAAQELQEEVKQEIISGYKPPAYGNETLPDIQLGAGSNTSSGLTSDELARLATTPHYSGTYVDPYLIARNGGKADWAYDVQTFRVPDDTQTTIAELSRNFVPPLAETYADNSDEAVQNLGLRIVGTGIGIGKAAYQAASGTVGLLGSWVGTGFDDVLGQSGLGWTNYFHADTEAFQHAVDSTARFLGNHPVATTMNAWGSALNRAAELSTSNNPMDQLKSGDILGQLSFNSVMAADGAAGLGKLGVSGASMLVDGAGNLAAGLSKIRFAGSADSYAGFAPQVGAVGDLSGFKPNIGGSLDVGDASPVRPLVAAESGIPTWKGTGPIPGSFGVNAETVSTKGLQNFFPKRGNVEYIFDPDTGTLLVGNGKWTHSPLASSINADTNRVVGGMFSRGSDGLMRTNEASGHFWRNWTPEVRQKFNRMMQSRGFNHQHFEGL